MRVVKSADALRPGGALAVVPTRYVAGGDERFFADAQRCYERWDPETPPRRVELPAAAEVHSNRDELDASGRFGRVVLRRYKHEQTYSTRE